MFHSARLIAASAGLALLRGKRVQKVGPHEHTLRMGEELAGYGELTLIKTMTLTPLALRQEEMYCSV